MANAKLLTTEDIEFLYKELRRSSIIWDGRKEVLRLARQKVFVRRARNGNAVYKYQWQCAACQKWFKEESQMEVDHIIEIGGYTEFLDGDISRMVERMFPRPVSEHLQCLCQACHKRKTGAYNSARSKWTRKKDL